MTHTVTDPKRPPAVPSQPPEAAATAAIAPRRTRHLRALAFRVYVLLAALVFVTLASLAHTVAYFPVDLRVTRAVQAYHGRGFETLMHAISWTGFFPQVAILSAVVIVTLFVVGLRWEAVAAAFATLSGAVGGLVKLVVLRPRPGADLVHVFQQLPSSGFPSGHVLTTTAFCGYLVFLAYTLLKPSLGRSGVIGVLLLFIALMGPSRIDMGQHWFSDVMGAFLFGSLWLALTIEFYRWGKVRYFAHQPVAPEAAPAPSAGSR